MLRAMSMTSRNVRFSSPGQATREVRFSENLSLANLARAAQTHTNVIVLGTSISEAENLIAYLKTRFVRYLVATRTSTQDMAPKAFEFVPVQEWSHIWTDEELFAKYGLDEAEMADICNSIPEME